MVKQMKDNKPNFFAVIIGSEILDGRRTDKHFEFLKKELISRGWKISGVYIIEDDIQIMKRTYELIKSFPNSVIFSFGGIGATPDDFTREVSASIFSNGKMEFNEEFRAKIVKKFGEKGAIHRVNMSNLPKNSELLYDNPVNGMCGFSIEQKFFFVPGFPEMAHPMIKEALNNFYPKNSEIFFSKSILVYTSENILINWMKDLPKNVTLSSLPKLDKDENGKISPTVDIQIKSTDMNILEEEIEKLLLIIKNLKVKFDLIPMK